MTILGSLPPSERWLAAGLVAWSPVFDTLGLARARFMVSRSDAVGMALSAALPSVVSFVGFVILFATGALTVFSAISVTIAASFSSYLVSFLRMRLEGAARPSPTRQMFSLAWRGAPYSAMEAVNLRLDQAVIPTLVGSAALGTYSVANSLANPLVRFGTVLSGGLYAEVKLSAPDAGRSAAGAAVRRAAAIVIVAGTSAMLLSPFAISALAGPAYSGALPMTLVLLPASGALVLAIVLANLLGALGKPALASGSQVGGLAVTLVLLVPAILLAGALGAAVVSLLSYGTRAALAFLLIRRLGVTQCIPSADDFRWVLRLVSR
jgi:O-antigen/teichoic acid export membrane protein